MDVPAAKIHFPPEDRQKLLVQIDGILESGQLTLGKYTQELEQKFAARVGTKYAIAVNSGTSALEIILRALDIQGSSVVVPTNTFFASPASVLHAGGKVIFADATSNLCIDPESVLQGLRSDVKAVMVVHIAGLVPPQMAQLQQVCLERGLDLIEDAAHAHGSTLDGQTAGHLGRAAAFSFYPTKVMTSAEGGIITTDDETVYKRALVFRDQGKAGFFNNLHTELGYNWRMSEVHAAIGLAQLARLDEFIAARRRVAAIFDKELSGYEWVRPVKMPPGARSNYYKYVAVLDPRLDRVTVKKELKEKFKVSLSGEVYELPCHAQPIFKDLVGSREGEFPIAEDLCRRHICLPVFATMTDEQAHYVVDCLRKVVAATQTKR